MRWRRYANYILLGFGQKRRYLTSGVVVRTVWTDFCSNDLSLSPDPPLLADCQALKSALDRRAQDELTDTFPCNIPKSPSCEPLFRLHAIPSLITIVLNRSELRRPTWVRADVFLGYVFGGLRKLEPRWRSRPRVL